MSSLLDRVKGAIFGSIIGDALGVPVDELTKDQVQEVYGGPILGFVDSSALSVCPFLRKGQFSHKSQIFLLMLEVYADNGKFNEDDFFKKLQEWKSHEENHRYPSCAHVEAAQSGAVKACDISGLIGAVASGIVFYNDSQEALKEGKIIVSLTHNDETIIDLAGLLSVAISSLVGNRVLLDSKQDKLEFIDALRKLSNSLTVKTYIDKVFNLIYEDKGLDEAILTVGNGEFALESFSMALYSFLRNSKSFTKVVLTAVNSYGSFGGAMSGIGFLAGAMSGAFDGFASIPVNLRENVEISNYIDTLSDRIYNQIKPNVEEI